MSIDEIAQNSIPHDFHGFLASTLEDIEKNRKNGLRIFAKIPLHPVYIYIYVYIIHMF